MSNSAAAATATATATASAAAAVAGLDPSKMKQVTLSPEEVARLRADDSNIFLEETHDAVERNLAPAEVAALLQVVRAMAVQERKNAPEISETILRSAVMRRSTSAAAFQRTHPRFFNVATAAETDAQTIEDMVELIDLRRRQDEGSISKEDAMKRVIAIEAARQKRAGTLPSQGPREAEAPAV
jgi:hypothetical protein